MKKASPQSKPLLEHEPTPPPEIEPTPQLVLEPEPESELDFIAELELDSDLPPTLPEELEFDPDPVLEPELELEHDFVAEPEPVTESDLPPTPPEEIKIPLLHEYLDPFLTEEPDTTSFQLNIEESFSGAFTIFSSTTCTIARPAAQGIHHQILESRLYSLRGLNSRMSFFPPKEN